MRACGRLPIVLVAFVLGFLGVVLPRPAAAGPGSGVIAGVVTDVKGKALSGAIVTVSSPALQGEEMVVTDDAGFYRVPNLPPGSYAVRVDRQDYFSNAQDGLSLRADITLRLNVQLAAESSQAENLVIKVRPTVDVGSSSTGANLDTEFLKRVPLAAPGGKGSAARSFESVAASAPGAANDDYGVSISGTTSLENRYVVDGLSVGNPGFGNLGSALSTEFVEEVNVVTGGYMPEYGRTTGGVLNVVTKSGSNQFQSSVFSYVSPGALEGSRTALAREGKTVLMEPALSYIADAGAGVGGPILKDRLWFYVGFDISNTKFDVRRSLHQAGMDAAGNTVLQEIPGTSNTREASLHTIQSMAKLTWAVAPDHRASFSVYAAPTSSGGDGKFSLEPESGLPEVGPDSDPGEYGALAHLRTARPIDLNFKWSSEFLGKKLLLDFMAGWHNERDEILGSDGTGPQAPTSGLASRSHVTWLRGDENTPPHGITDFESVPTGYCDAPGAAGVRCPVSTYASGGPGDLRIKTFNRYQSSVTLTFLTTGLGHHLLKAGADTELTDFTHQKSISGGRFLEESGDGKTFLQAWGYGLLVRPDDTQFLTVYPTHSKSVSLGGFLQDSWSVADKVTVNAGLRYDTQLLYDNSGSIGMSLANEWSPRIGLIYDFTQNGRSKVFASYARYYQTVSLDVADVTLSGDPHLRATIDATKCDPRQASMDTGAGSACHTSYISGPDTGLPNRTWTQIGGGKTLVDPALKPPASDEVTFGAEYDLLADNRIGVSYNRRWLTNWMEDMSLDNMQSWIYGNPGYGIASGFPRAERKYDALTFFWSKAFSHNWLGQASYTVTYLRGNVQGLFSKGSDLAPNHLGDFDIARIETNRVGPLPGDNRHTFKIFTAKDWLVGEGHRIATGLALRGHSGDPTNYLGKDPVADENATFVLPRGSGERLPWQFSADLQIGYRLVPSKTTTISLTLDVFNLFNFQAATGRDETYTYNNVLALQNGKLSDLRTVEGGVPEVNPSFGAATTFQPPRTFRFGMRADF